MPFVAAAAMLMLYAYNLPVVIAFIWKKHRFAAGIGAFSPSFAVSRAEKQLASPKPRKKVKFKRIKRVSFITARLIHELRIDHYSARLLIGTGDAAMTARLCGAAIALGHTLRTKARNGAVDIRPDFSARTFEGEIVSVLTLRAGQMARAAIKYAMER